MWHERPISLRPAPMLPGPIAFTCGFMQPEHANNPRVEIGHSCNRPEIPGITGRGNQGVLAGLCLKGENSRVAAIIGSYRPIFTL